MAEPSTDAEQCKLLLDPEMRDEVDKRRGVTEKRPKGKKTRQRLILETLADAFGMKKYKPRERGQPKKDPKS